MPYQYDPSHEIKPYRIKRDNSDRKAVRDTIDVTQDPFSVSEGDHNEEDSFFLSTGKACTKDIWYDLTNLTSIGGKWQREFLDECTKTTLILRNH